MKSSGFAFELVLNPVSPTVFTSKALTAAAALLCSLLLLLFCPILMQQRV